MKNIFINILAILLSALGVVFFFVNSSVTLICAVFLVFTDFINFFSGKYKNLIYKFGLTIIAMLFLLLLDYFIIEIIALIFCATGIFTSILDILEKPTNNKNEMLFFLNKLNEQFTEINVSQIFFDVESIIQKNDEYSLTKFLKKNSLSIEHAVLNLLQDATIKNGAYTFYKYINHVKYDKGFIDKNLYMQNLIYIDNLSTRNPTEKHPAHTPTKSSNDHKYKISKFTEFIKRHTKAKTTKETYFEVANLKISKKIIIALSALITIAAIATPCIIRYNNLSDIAIDNLGIYLAAKLPDYIAMDDLSCTVTKSKGDYIVKIGGNVEGNYNYSTTTKRDVATLYAEIKYKNLFSKPKVVKALVNGEKVGSSKNSRKYWLW